MKMAACDPALFSYRSSQTLISRVWGRSGGTDESQRFEEEERQVMMQEN